MVATKAVANPRRLSPSARRLRLRSRSGILSLDEGRRLFDHQSRRTLGISGDEFLRRWDAGEYRVMGGPEEGRRARSLALLLPFARRTPV
ncbi:MAG: hypothetical protein AVDCRST_MAG59-5268 [uncultured Thermomicrobiales bacterium]|uniref:Uncharacterized protein n=1 Tax=uncultured Thermomicrobiales bacterium TaxID=1645740 RepID=A0A6J4VND3_9BACT|nr:MAG: hypothetical protein AVDCRST_MAG59-5268 [uncultured Thermomicrobiales bacterium]